MDKKTFDIIIIGAGPGGYVAALRAGQLGLKVALIERENVGGVCLNWGCIPTKALLKSADVYRLLRHANHYGLSAPTVDFDLGKLVERSRDVANKLVSGVHYLLKKNKVTLVEGQAIFKADGTLRVLNQLLEAPNIIVATGARARHFPTQSKAVWYYKQALAPESLPKTLLIVGSGAIGIEFAYFYATLGVKVTLLETASRILLTEDEQIADLALKALSDQGITIVTNAQIQSIEDDASGGARTIFTVSGETKELVTERVIMAIGVVPNVEDLGLETLGIAQTPSGFIQTDAFGKTNKEGIWAIGDVAGPPCLAHKASHEGVRTVETIAGLVSHTWDKSFIPGCIYAYPQIASIGLTESEARKSGTPIKVGLFPFVGNGKAIAIGEKEGLIKTIFDAQTGALLGAHMIGADVTELIGTFALGKTLETTEEEFMNTIFPHPTLSEMLHESVLASQGKALHI